MSFTPRPLRGVAQSSLGELGPDSPFFEVGGGERPEHRTSSIDGYRAAELGEAASKTSGNVEPLQPFPPLSWPRTCAAANPVTCSTCSSR